MKSLNTHLARALLIFSLMLPWATTEALERFEQAGYITDIGISSFVVRGTKYRIAPGAKLSSKSAKRRSFSDFRKGDEIYFKGEIVNGVYHVNIIYYEDPVPS